MLAFDWHFDLITESLRSWLFLVGIICFYLIFIVQDYFEKFRLFI
jgi:hypothetical protein